MANPATHIVGTKPTYIADIAIGDIVIRPEAQRDLQLARAKAIADNWRDELVSTLVVNDRGDGKYSCMDGQHRHKGGEINGTILVLPCVVHTGLTPQQEAQLFLALQRERKSVSPFSEYRVAVTAGEPWALSVESVLHGHALDVGSGPGTYQIAAIKTLEKVFAFGGQDLLELTIAAVKGAYCPLQGRDAWGGDIIGGVARFYAKNPSADQSRVVKVLQSQIPAQWAADVAVLSKGSGGSEGRPIHLARLLARHYNKGLRSASKRVAE